MMENNKLGWFSILKGISPPGVINVSVAEGKSLQILEAKS
jgi:hypothetical protein